MLEVPCCESIVQMPAGLPRLPLAPRRKLAAMHALLCQLKQKLQELPETPERSCHDSTERSDSTAVGMCTVYLDGQREIANMAVQVLEKLSSQYFVPLRYCASAFVDP